MGIFETIVGFVLGVLGNYVATTTQPPIPNIWQRRLDERLADESSLREALASRRSLRDELRLACRALSQNLALPGRLSESEREIWLLLSDVDFQDDLAEWLMSGGIDEGALVRERLEQRMENVLLRSGARIEQITTFKAHYFDMVDRAIFSVPLLAAWRHQRGGVELEVSDSWQETLRLLVADCKDDDVDEVLLAIATPLLEEDPARMGRPRAVLAARCLADEPNVSEETAQDILARLVAQVSERDGRGPIQTTVDGAAIELAHSIWSARLKNSLVHEFLHRSTDDCINCGGLWATVAINTAPQTEPLFLA